MNCPHCDNYRAIIDRLCNERDAKPVPVVEKSEPNRAAKLVAEVCRHKGICVGELFGDQKRMSKHKPGSHNDRVTAAREEIAYRLHDELGLSYPECAVMMGRKYHSFAHAAARRYAARIGKATV